MPTPPPAVRPVLPQPATGIEIAWTYLESGSYAKIDAWQDDYLRFRWTDGTYSLRQVTKVSLRARRACALACL